MAANSTSFQPGRSGNPGGRPKMPVLPDGRTIGDVARDKSVAALEVLCAIANDSLAPAAARVTAATAILDRGYGKPQTTFGDTEGNALDWIEVLAVARARRLEST